MTITMKSFVFVFFICLSLGTVAQDKITTFILVRHAEKATTDQDTELSVQGNERATRLAALLKNTAITAVYSTKYKRTQNTIAPTAKEKSLTITTYDNLHQTTLAELATKYAGGTILIAGHSNTIPAIANTLLGKKEFENFSESEYGNILIVSVIEVGKMASIVRLSY
jgi:2,3-bisphosphoglycerate-dependent phosphoglycerate mutase